MDFMVDGRARPILVTLALVTAVAVAAIACSSTFAGSGGIGPSAPTGSSSAGADETSLTPPKYSRLWDRVSRSNRRWARATSECESGRDPDAVALRGRFRGAFMFTRNAWATSPKTPGGDPIDYSYKTQAVVAVALKNRDGTRPWPVCG
jgi:hypothetical protein